MFIDGKIQKAVTPAHSRRQDDAARSVPSAISERILAISHDTSERDTSKMEHSPKTAPTKRRRPAQRKSVQYRARRLDQIEWNTLFTLLRFLGSLLFCWH